MKKLVAVLIVIALALVAASFAQIPTPQQRTGPLEFTVNVPSGGVGSGVPLSLWERAKHIRVYVGSNASIKFYGIVKIRGASGMPIAGATVRKPYGAAGNYPGASDNVWAPFPSGTLVWNTYRDVGADSLFVYNEAGTASDVTFQILVND